MNLLFILLIIGLVLVGIAYKYFFSKGSDQVVEKVPTIYRYTRKDYFMSSAEHDFFKTLIEITNGQYYVFPQVHLSTIINHKVKGQNWKAAFRHIDEKSVDFVICDKSFLKPLLAIELDDSSHDEESRRQRDIEVERIFEEAKFPLIRFTNLSIGNKENISRRLSEVLNN